MATCLCNPGPISANVFTQRWATFFGKLGPCGESSAKAGRKETLRGQYYPSYGAAESIAIRALVLPLALRVEQRWIHFCNKTSLDRKRFRAICCIFSFCVHSAPRCREKRGCRLVYLLRSCAAHRIVARLGLFSLPTVVERSAVSEVSATAGAFLPGLRRKPRTAAEPGLRLKGSRAT